MGTGLQIDIEYCLAEVSPRPAEAVDFRMRLAEALVPSSRYDATMPDEHGTYHRVRTYQAAALFGQAEAVAHVTLVFAHHRFNVNVNVLPFPGALSTPMVPPCASTMCFTIARPSPVPPTSRDRSRSMR